MRLDECTHRVAAVGALGEPEPSFLRGRPPPITVGLERSAKQKPEEDLQKLETFCSLSTRPSCEAWLRQLSTAGSLQALGLSGISPSPYRVLPGIVLHQLACPWQFLTFIREFNPRKEAAIFSSVLVSERLARCQRETRRLNSNGWVPPAFLHARQMMSI
jgi:hypothetical protein